MSWISYPNDITSVCQWLQNFIYYRITSFFLSVYSYTMLWNVCEQISVRGQPASPCAITWRRQKVTSNIARLDSATRERQRARLNSNQWQWALSVPGSIYRELSIHCLPSLESAVLCVGGQGSAGVSGNSLFLLNFSGFSSWLLNAISSLCKCSWRESLVLAQPFSKSLGFWHTLHLGISLCGWVLV